MMCNDVNEQKGKRHKKEMYTNQNERKEGTESASEILQLVLLSARDRIHELSHLEIKKEEERGDTREGHKKERSQTKTEQTKKKRGNFPTRSDLPSDWFSCGVPPVTFLFHAIYVHHLVEEEIDGQRTEKKTKTKSKKKAK